jgi:integrase
MRYREPFTVFRRTMPSGRVIWYYQTYDETGKRTGARSTGQLTKSGARAYCRKLQNEDQLIPKVKQSILFKDYAKGWWTKGECEYLQYRSLRRNLSQSYIQYCRGAMIKHILPYFAKFSLISITQLTIEKWINHQVALGVSSSTINTHIGILHIMLSDAVRRDLIIDDPTRKVQKLMTNHREKGIFTNDMVTKLFDPENKEIIWKRKECYLANLLGACTGMRISEIIGLQYTDIKDGYILVSKQFHSKYGIQPTKTKKNRIIPIPKSMEEELRNTYHKCESDFIFTHGNYLTEPIPSAVVLSALYMALVAIGISEDERKERNLTFHSWRHYFNTIMRSNNLADSKLQNMTGHSSRAMTDHYTHYAAEDLKEVVKIQAKILPFSNAG